MKANSKTSPPTPLQVVPPAKKRKGKEKLIAEIEDRRELELDIVDTNASGRKLLFELPNDWVVEERPRANCRTKHVDRYYYEPGSGRQFRSLLSVQRYLSGEIKDMPQRTVTSRIYEKSMRIVPHTYGTCSRFKLPSGWIIEERPRSSSDVIDRYYIEPGTGVRFRSLISVERYLTHMKKSSGKPTSSSAKDNSLQIVLRSPEVSKRLITLPERSKTSRSQKKRGSHDEVERSMLDFTSTPSKVKWVLGGPRGNLWRAFMDESLVPEPAMQTWSKTFIRSMQNNE